MRYYVNKNAQSSGEHEVHVSSCSFLPKEENRIYLGDFLYSGSAVVEAKKYYNNVDRCAYCSPSSHTK